MPHPSDHGEPHPLATFKPRAVVDWVILRFTTPHATQYQHLRNRMPTEWRAHAKPIGKNKNSSRDWLLTIQDPPSASAIARVLSGQGVDPCGVGVQAIEIAIDWYPRFQEARAELARAAHHLFRHLARPPAGTPRIREPGHYRAAARPRDTLSALTEGLTVNLGAQDADHRARFYVKRHDSTQAGAHQNLPEAQHRARGEVTLIGEALPIKTLADLASFKFETLARHLALRKTTTPKTQTSSLYRQQVQQWGRTDDTKKRAGHRRQNHLATCADTTANGWIYSALRGLTRRQKNAEIPAFFGKQDNRPAEGKRAKSPVSPKYLERGKRTHSPEGPSLTSERPCTPYPDWLAGGTPWRISTPRFRPTYKHFAGREGLREREKIRPWKTQAKRMVKRLVEAYIMRPAEPAQPSCMSMPGRTAPRRRTRSTVLMSYLLALTILSAPMTGDPHITRDQHVDKVYPSLEACQVWLQSHMINVRPGHIWSGQTPLPNGVYSPCQPTPKGYKPVVWRQP